jgi:uncharacterized protein DUF2330
MRWRLFSLLGAGLAVGLLPMEKRTAQGCAPVWGRIDTPIAIAEESAVIIWDAGQKIQHFIRWARFENASQDFGFLVPTPTQPQLKEADDNIFYHFEEWTAPKIVKTNELSFEPMFCIFGCGAKMASPLNSVRVLDRQIVGGFDAAVLEADDAEALRQWLETHDYIARPELTSWLAPYIAEKWKITAFKIAPQQGGNKIVQTVPVRMSFHTDRPFFPYREPKDNGAATQSRRANRVLRVYFVGQERVHGLRGNSEWSAQASWSGALDEPKLANLAKTCALEIGQLPSKARLTVFEDPSSPRLGSEEVWFEPNADQSKIEPPARTMRTWIWIPSDVAVVGFIILATIGYQVRKRAKSEAPPTPASRSETPPPDTPSR